MTNPCPHNLHSVGSCSDCSVNGATPSPQSVVVPDPLAEMRAAAGYLRNAKIDLETGAPKSTAIRTIQGGLKRLEASIDAFASGGKAIAAAPAPSSLAGGEVTNDQIQSVMLAAIKEVRVTVTDATEGACMDADIIRMESGLVDMGDTGWAVMRAVHRRLAALSPEAPARATEEDVEDTPWPESPLANALFRHVQSQFSLYDDEASEEAGEIIAILVKHGVDPTKLPALTPRHEAPAEGAGEREEIAHEIYDFLNERFPDGALPGGVQLFADAGDHTDADMKHEAGCDELAGRILALRARSSAPEAREEALGNLLAVIHGDGGHRALEVGTKQAALEAEKIVAGLLAAPSADKLRIAVEALSWSEKALERYVDALGLDQTDDAALHALYLCGDALAALKAEGA